MTRSSQSYSTLALIGCFIAVVSGAAAALAGPAYRWNLLALGEAFVLLRWAAYGGLAACAVCIPAMVLARPAAPRKGLWLSVTGLCLGAAVFWLPYSQQRLAREVPAIHDITTDTRNPPAFRALLSIRPEGANSLDYGGESLARRQREAYPDIGPLEIRAPLSDVFDAVVATARELDWRIVEASRDQGRLEAVDTTFWFGFKDDIVVRLTDTPDGIRVDVRSVSRIGVSDVGKNASRIRTFLAALETRV